MLSDEEIKDRVVRLTAELVQIKSQAGVDEVLPILNRVRDLLSSCSYPQLLEDDRGQAVGVYARVPHTPSFFPWLGESVGLISPHAPGQILCLNACLDTAPIGDEASWSDPPFSGRVRDGRLYGRGAADSKVGCALFLTLADDLYRSDAIQRGWLDVLFDADEHSGRFMGVKTYIKSAGKPGAVAIGYPGNDQIKIGARGFLRAVITTYGRAEHSGRRKKDAANAITKMLKLLTRLRHAGLPPELDSSFSFGPKLSVTAISGGEGFSQIPDHCSCNVDLRLTPNFVAEDGKAVVKEIIEKVDRREPDSKPTEIEWLEHWPHYKLDLSDPLVRSLRESASREFARSIPTSVSGASNIGNYLSTLGVPAICGFGVSCENLHAANESFKVDSIVPTYKAYREAVLGYLAEAGRMEAGDYASSLDAR